MGLYPVGILEETGKFTVYVPEIDLDTWLNEEEQLANDGMPKQGDIVQVKFPGSDDWNDAIFVSMFK